MRKLTQTLALLVLTLSLLLGGCAQPAPGPSGSQSGSTSTASETAASLDNIPAFSGEPYVVIDDNQPSFTASELTTSSFESYAPLDSLGRCGVAYACISTDLMPADGEKRGSISEIKPSGWVTAKYDFVDGKYLYNRCHLIGWQLTAENANRSNLITMFLNAAITQKPLALSKEEFRGITYVREVAEQTLQAVNLPGGAYNFGSEADVSMYALAELFMKKTGMKLNLQEKSGGENLWMNCAKLKNAGGGFETTAEGLATCIEDYNLSLLGQ